MAEEAANVNGYLGCNLLDSCPPQDFARDRYGLAGLLQSKDKTGRKWLDIASLSVEMAKQRVLLRGRLHTKRVKGGRAFLILRQKDATVQGLVSVNETTVSKPMIKFISTVPNESIIDIEGTIEPVEEEIHSCTQKFLEIHVDQFYVISKSAERLPFSIEDASRPEAETEEEDAAEGDGPKAVRVNLDTRLDNRIIDLRTISNQAIFRIQSGVGLLFREFLYKHDFVEIHSPKIISAASEGGANVFQVSYFKGKCLIGCNDG